MTFDECLTACKNEDSEMFNNIDINMSSDNFVCQVKLIAIDEEWLHHYGVAATLLLLKSRL